LYEKKQTFKAEGRTVTTQRHSDYDTPTMANSKRMRKEKPFSKLSACVVISVASLIVYNSVRSFRSLKHVEQRRVAEGIVRATRSSTSDFDTFSSAWSSSVSNSPRPLHTEPTEEAKNRTSAAAVAALPQPVPLPTPTQQLQHNTTTSSSSFQNSTILDTSAAPTTPTKQQEQEPLCSRQQIQTGQWLPVTLDKPPYVTKTKHLRCYPSEYYKPEHKHASNWFPSWDWQPTDTSCRLVPWDLNDFCRLVQAATVSIIGDSLSWEQYSSLLQLAGQRVHQNDQHKSKSEKRNHVQYACRGVTGESNRATGTKFVFRNDARLTNITDSIQQDFPVVLILNRGAHYVNDTSLMTDVRETIVPAVQAWWRECQTYHLKCHLFWRTTVPGHVGCDQIKQSENDNSSNDSSNSSKALDKQALVKEAVNLTVYNTDLHSFSEPVNDFALMEARLYNQSLYSEKQWLKFHWQDVPRQNQLVLEELSALSTSLSSPSLSSKTTTADTNATAASPQPISVTIIDAYKLNMLRPDDHRAVTGDCLHNCYPGKMDVYNQLLLHHLSMQRTAEDVQQLQKLQQRARDARDNKYSSG
jgi:hypothetical protein